MTFGYLWPHCCPVCLSGRPYGADDFLPMLTHVLAQCDMPQLDNEILYMMELLDPSLLHGEGVCVCVCVRLESLYHQLIKMPNSVGTIPFPRTYCCWPSASVHPCLGGYYLTSAYGAMSLIRNFQEEQAAKVLSSETRNTLHQWHRRRTTSQRAAPSIDDFQVKTRWSLLSHQ